MPKTHICLVAFHANIAEPAIVRVIAGRVTYQMLLEQAPNICCTFFPELLRVAVSESTTCKAANNMRSLRK